MSAAASADSTSTLDRAFVTSAGQSGLEQVRFARLALRASSTPRIVAYATQMHDLYSRLNVQLMSAAGAQHMALPIILPASYEAALVRLRSERGPGFDRNYLTLEVRDNTRTVTAFKDEVVSGTDPALRNFARATIPALEQHIRLARHGIAAIDSARAGHTAVLH